MWFNDKQLVFIAKVITWVFATVVVVMLSAIIGYSIASLMGAL